MKRIILSVGVLLMLAGCNYRAREQALQARESALAQREQALFVREQTLQLKETELQHLAQRLDSTLRDTAFVYNPDLVGHWNVKMTCTETTCHGSAVGDTKLEVWNIYYNDRRVIAKAMDGQKLVRVYTGAFKDGQLELGEEPDISPGIPITQMFVRLTSLDSLTMEGQREILRSGDCRILYDLQLKKQLSPTR
jgi:hypothetical protein